MTNPELTNHEWKEFTGSDEQIAEMTNSKCGWICRFDNGSDSGMCKGYPANEVMITAITSYWIIPEDPLREMKIRWSQTGQPVWVRVHHETMDCTRTIVYEEKLLPPTTAPDWNIPCAEYRFTPFEEEV